ncbi:MAG: ATP-binding protein [Muribaculaceae bacterium]|nr:ATP-binding protein [Muribaculaceae bacterium]
MKFWLHVRKEYITDNIDNLIDYLQHCDNSPLTPNPDYQETLDCLRDYCKDIAKEVAETPCDSTPRPTCGYDMAVRIIGATVLAGFKSGYTEWSAFLALIDLLARQSSASQQDTLESLALIVRACLRRLIVSSTGFTWGDISSQHVNTQILLHKLALARFREPVGAHINHILDNKGILIIPHEGIPVLSMVDLNKYAQGQFDELFVLPRMLQVVGPSDKYDCISGFQEMYASAIRMLNAGTSYKPAPKIVLNQYGYEDCFPVRIISKAGWRIEAESLDPNYEKIVGKILLEMPNRRPSMVMVKDTLAIGDIITVYRSKRESYEFEIFDAFEDYYRQVGASVPDTEFQCIFKGRYKTGTEWISHTGLRIGVDNSKLLELEDEDREAVEKAIERKEPIILRTYAEAPDTKKESFNIYGELVDLGGQKFTEENADRFIINGWIKYAEGLASDFKTILTGDFQDIAPKEVSTLSILMYKIGEVHLLPPITRLRYYTAAALLWSMIDDTENLDIALSRMAYLLQLVNFAAGKEVKMPGQLTGRQDQSSIQAKQLIEVLQSYKKKTEVSERNISLGIDFNEKKNRIKALVEASNNLLDIIDERELDNIKHLISRILNVDEEYESILSNRTYYGDETIYQEFKSSMIYPPENRLTNPNEKFEPELQKWIIRRAVCGFLNSRAGGDVIIGVNDEGYAIGLQDEINDLYAHRLITKPNIDQYSLYINRQLYDAFSELDGNRDSKEIANTHIDVYPESNEEGRLVVRIKIRPYQKKIIKLNDPNHDRPKGMGEWFFRKNKRTIDGTPGAVEEILKFK